MGVVAPASGASVGIFYAVGVIFASPPAVHPATTSGSCVTGTISDEELVMVKESEEQEELEALQKELEEQERLEREGAPATAARASPN